jgi:hypothetical protein
MNTNCSDLMTQIVREAVQNASLAPLWFLISDGVAMDPKKVAVMDSWPAPKTLRALRGFLGLTRYYRKFIAHYGDIARPLTALLKRGTFRWSPEADAAFQC